MEFSKQEFPPPGPPTADVLNCALRKLHMVLLSWPLSHLCMPPVPKWNIFFLFPLPMTNANSQARMKEVNYGSPRTGDAATTASPAKTLPYCIINVLKALPFHSTNEGGLKSPKHTGMSLAKRSRFPPFFRPPRVGRGSRNVTPATTTPLSRVPELTLSGAGAVAVLGPFCGLGGLVRLGPRGPGGEARGAQASRERGNPARRPGRRHRPSLPGMRRRRRRKEEGLLAKLSLEARPPPPPRRSAPCALLAGSARPRRRPRRARAAASTKGRCREAGPETPVPGSAPALAAEFQSHTSLLPKSPPECIPGNDRGTCGQTLSHQVTIHKTGWVFENEKKKTPNLEK